jgi:molybdate transport system substrate-binding protein
VPRAEQGASSGLSVLASDKVGKIAVANPEHAPYGKAARESIERAGLLSRVEAKLVVASNVGESLQFARSGNADCAFVSRALLLSEPAGSPRTLDVPDELYAPLEQALVVCPGKPKGAVKPDDAHVKSVAAARAFAALVGSEKGRAVLNKYGFLPPGQVPQGAGKHE